MNKRSLIVVLGSILAVAALIWIVARSPELGSGNDLSSRPVDSVEGRFGASLQSSTGRSRFGAGDDAASIFRAATIAEQQTAYLTASPEAKFDAAVLLSYGLQVCNYFPNGAPTPTRSTKASLDAIAEFRKRYCSTGVDAVGGLPADYLQLALIEASDAGDRAASSVFEAGNILQDQDPAGKELESAAERLANVIETTDSPALFILAHSYLSDPRLDDIRKDPVEAPTGLSEDERRRARYHAGPLAMCLSADMCHANGVFAIRSCMPFKCAPGQDYIQYVRGNLTPVEFEWAMAYARALANRK